MKEVTLDEQIAFAKSFSATLTPDWYHMSEAHCTAVMLAIYESLAQLKGLQK